MVDLASVIRYAHPPQNIVGSTLFLAYIALALYGSTAISTSLYKQYSSIAFPEKSKKKEKKKEKTDEKEQLKTIQDARKRHIKIYAFLASISFATLSYHMLSFLITSYAKYSGKNSLALKNLTVDNLKAWMVNTSLFDTFAKELVRDGPSTAWTQIAILATYFWNLWMADKGKKVGIRNLHVVRR